MKVNIYYGGRGLMDDPTLYVINKMQEVLEELNVKVERFMLKELRGSITTLPQTLKDADGIILATTVEWYGIGCYMQEFLDSCWLYGDKEKIAGIYMCPIVMSTTYGEREGKLNLLTAWEILGGQPCSGICGYIPDTSELEISDEYTSLIERKAENVYRTIKQKVVSFPASNQAVKQKVLVSKSMKLTPQESEQLSEYAADDSYVQQQKEDLQELASMFRGMMNQENTESISIEDLVNQIAEETGITKKEKESLTEALYNHYFEEEEEELEVQADVDYEVSDSDRIQTIQDSEIEGLESGEKVFEVGPRMVETENMTSNSNQMGSQNRGSETKDNSGKIEVVNLKKNKAEAKVEVETEEGLTYTEATNNFEEKLSEVKSEIVNKNQNIENPEEVIKQITEKAKFFITEDKSEVVIKLKPDHLGKVSLKISIENGNISAKFLAESEKVREMLESNFNSLKESLNKQGLNIQNLSVSVGNSNKERNFEQETSIMSRRINARRVVSLGINNSDNIEDVEMSGMLRNNYYWPNSTVSYTA